MSDVARLLDQEIAALDARLSAIYARQALTHCITLAEATEQGALMQVIQRLKSLRDTLAETA